MILNAIVTWFMAIPTFLLNLMPGFTAPSWVTGYANAMTLIGNVLRIADAWINVPIILTMMGFIVSSKIIKGTVNAVLMVYDRIPAKAT